VAPTEPGSNKAISPAACEQNADDLPCVQALSPDNADTEHRRLNGAEQQQCAPVAADKPT
jgi:hypothetical protein